MRTERRVRTGFGKQPIRLAALAAAAALAGWLGLGAQQAATRSEQEQTSYRKAMEEADQKIAAAEQEHSEVVQNEEYLTTFIGPRLTGSPGMQKASQWTLEMFRKYGVDAHLETTEIPHAWYRGNDWGELASPVEHWMTVRSAAWSKPTAGPVEGPLATIDENTKPEDIAANPDKYKGAIVLSDEPAGEATLPENAANAYDAVIPPPRGVPSAGRAAGFRERFANLRKVMDALAKVGAEALLRDSQKPYAELVSGSAGFPAYEPSTLPTAYVSHPDYEWLLRLAKAGAGRFRINLAGKFSDGPGQASITVAEIKGSQLPDERVIVGGHLDSWDLGEGAVDNGTGAMATLEAARLLKSLGWTPKRTLTFILFTGEEQGGIGVRTFLKNHAGEIPKMDAVLVDDTGAGRLYSISVENFWSTGPLMEEIYRPLEEVFDLLPMSNQYFGSSDHVAFQREGVPAYFGVQDPARYGEAHHSQYDVFEIIQPAALREQAGLLAAWMWNVSEMPEALPHHAKEPAQPPM
ncbi:MAG TPA: M20/M25/M40 family metallo-hydrolase [Candidatus Acidoferrales bacterium]|nr:M20/M25/M40 family metallo-hydrolase [Candidatus Acidoferrales bacterium]